MICTSLVPTARLELAQLSPLPPQDSVSTNSTTSATRCESEILPLVLGGLNRTELQTIIGRWSVQAPREPLRQRLAGPAPAVHPEPSAQTAQAQTSP